VAGDGEGPRRAAGEKHESVDPARRLFDVTASATRRKADTARAFEFGGACHHWHS